jgi:5-methylcytosine-specific restriction endonuclease McrA
MEKKVCSHCGKEKEVSKFYTSKQTKDGFFSWCRSCLLLDQKSGYYGDSTDYRTSKLKREYNKKWHRDANRTPSGKFYNLKFRAKKSNIPFLLTRKQFGEWFLNQELKCHYCGKSVNFGGEDYTNGNSMKHLTIDRKNTILGYDIDNIVISCRKCNTIKGDWFTEKEMLEIANKYLKGETNGEK